MQMQDRSNSQGDDYRYGFNGMEKDNEVKGKGNSYTTQFRQYDSRLGRWLSTDPVTHPQYSPYSAFDNNPVYYADPSGADATEGGEDPGPAPVETVPKPSKRLPEPSIPKGTNFDDSPYLDGPDRTIALKREWDAYEQNQRDWAYYDKEHAKYKEAWANWMDDVHDWEEQNGREWRAKWSSTFGAGQLFVAYDIATTVIGVKAVATGVKQIPKLFANAKNYFQKKNIEFAKGYLKKVGEYDNFEVGSIKGFTFSFGKKIHVYHNSAGAASKTPWFTTTKYTSQYSAFNKLGLGYKNTQNFAQFSFQRYHFGIAIKGTASAQGKTLGGGVQYLGVRLGNSYKLDFKLGLKLNSYGK
jgi:RHS repeat-associated protein